MVIDRICATAALATVSLVIASLGLPIAEAGTSGARQPDERAVAPSSEVLDRVDEATQLHLRAIALQSAGEYRAAEAMLRQALEEAPGRVSTLIGLAKLFVEEGKEDAARAEIILKAVPWGLKRCV